MTRSALRPSAWRTCRIVTSFSRHAAAQSGESAATRIHFPARSAKVKGVRKAFVVDFAAVPFLDSTAANVLGRVAVKAHRQGIKLFITGASPAVRRALLTHGVTPPRARYRTSLERAIADIKGGASEEAAAG